MSRGPKIWGRSRCISISASPSGAVLVYPLKYKPQILPNTECKSHHPPLAVASHQAREEELRTGCLCEIGIQFNLTCFPTIIFGTYFLRKFSDCEGCTIFRNKSSENESDP